MTDTEILAAARELVASQAQDEGLWFVAGTAWEAYLQRELRKLHAVIEGKEIAFRYVVERPEPK